MTPAGLLEMQLDEGCKLRAYPDPNSPLARVLRVPLAKRPKGWAALSGAPWTIGCGATGLGITPTTIWTQQQADADLAARVSLLEMQLTRTFKWFLYLTPVRRDVLVNIAYNVGFAALTTWTNTLSHIAAGAYDAAADDLLHEGKWNRDVGQRAVRLAAAMRTSTWPDPG